MVLSLAILIVNKPRSPTDCSYATVSCSYATVLDALAEEAALLDKCQQAARSNRRYYPFTGLMHRLKVGAVARHALESCNGRRESPSVLRGNNQILIYNQHSRPTNDPVSCRLGQAMRQPRLFSVRSLRAAPAWSCPSEVFTLTAPGPSTSLSSSRRASIESLTGIGAFCGDVAVGVLISRRTESSGQVINELM